MALGSTVRSIVVLVLGEGALLIGAGLLLGLAGALAVARAPAGARLDAHPRARA